jgi:hypothetical protein
MRKRSLILGTIIAAEGVLMSRGIPEPTLDDLAGRAEAIGRRHGLLIGFGDPARFYTPPFGATDAVIPGCEAEPVVFDNLSPSLDGIATSLALYPPGFIAKLCRAIFICGNLRCEGVSAGGTYGPAWIILSANPVFGPGGIYETARLGVHHEFSSLVLARFPALVPRWMATLPVGWQGIESTRDALLQAGGEGHDGFLSSYGATSVENDFNTYAETVFGDPAKLVELARKSRIVRQKATLLLGVYVSLDERLTAIFRSFGLGELLVGSGDHP